MPQLNMDTIAALVRQHGIAAEVETTGGNVANVLAVGIPRDGEEPFVIAAGPGEYRLAGPCVATTDELFVGRQYEEESIVCGEYGALTEAAVAGLIIAAATGQPSHYLVIDGNAFWLHNDDLYYAPGNRARIDWSAGELVSADAVADLDGLTTLLTAAVESFRNFEDPVHDI